MREALSAVEREKQQMVASLGEARAENSQLKGRVSEVELAREELERHREGALAELAARGTRCGELEDAVRREAEKAERVSAELGVMREALSAVEREKQQMVASLGEARAENSQLKGQVNELELARGELITRLNAADSLNANLLLRAERKSSALSAVVYLINKRTV